MSDDKEKQDKIYHGELSGSMKGLHAGTMMSQLQEHRSEAQKKECEKATEQALKLLSKLQEDMEGLLGDIDGMVDDYKDSKDRQSRLREMRDNNNIEGIRLMLIEEYHMNSADVAEMSDDEVLNQADDFDKQETLTQETLIEGIKATVAEYRQKANEAGELDPKVEAQYLTKLTELEEKYRPVLGADFNKAFGEAARNDRDNQELYEVGKDGVLSSAKLAEKEDTKEVKSEISSIASVTPTNSGLDF
ncbi:MAG: hypothetical protein ABJF04_16125 [Reichenbachiella sp.]|uniref:hypothetical protein n=1 Tax=Reichenbachiella sp. TaxID=2184521 RepID=UPI003267590A